MRLIALAAGLALLAAPALADHHEAEGMVPPPTGEAQTTGPAQPKEAVSPTPPGAKVARSAFATDIQDREPLDEVTTLSNDHDRVFFFAELHGLEGRTVTYRWEWNGQVMAEVPVQVGGPRWRAYSSKNLFAGWLGQWKVAVVDQSGEVLQEVAFAYVQAEETPPAAEGGAPEPEAPAAAPASMD